MPGTTRVPSSRGVDLTLHDLGGEGPPLLIAHATGFCGGAYRSLARPLAEHHRVLAVDFRGHGQSSRPDDGDFTWDGMGDDVLAVVEAVGQPVAAFGHSMGGAALLLAEARSPGTLRCAYLFEPIVRPAETAPPPGTTNPLAEGSRRRRPTFPSKAAALQRFAAAGPLSVLRADALHDYVDAGFEEESDGTARLRCAPLDEAATFEGANVTVERVAGVSLPVVVAVGERGEGFSPATFAPFLVEALDEALLERFGHLGHFGPLQDPDTVADAVLALSLRSGD